MANLAQGSRSRLAYVKEVTAGTTPGSPTMLALPINSHSLSLKKTLVESSEIRSDRNTLHQRHGNKNVAGDFATDFRADDFDDFLEAAFFNTFSSALVLTNGVTPKYFSIEDGALDIAQYRLYKGCSVSKFGLVARPNQMVVATFGLVGFNMTQSTSQQGAPVAASTNKPFDTFTATLQEGGSPLDVVTEATLDIDNGMQPTFVIGSPITPQLEYGRCKVSGKLSAYFKDAVLINEFLNETETSLSLAFTDGTSGNTYTFWMPRVKFNTADVPLQNEQSRPLTLDYTALLHSSGYTVRLTKS